MNPATIIREAQAEGVGLELSNNGTIRATGDGAAVNRWLTVIRERKSEIIDVLRAGAGDTATASGRWLIHYPGRDPVETVFDSAVTHAEILELYPEAVAAEHFTPTIRQPSEPLIANDEIAIHEWLALIEETDPATIAEVIAQCRQDADARDYFRERAAAELSKSDPFSDDRLAYDHCANLPARQDCGDPVI